ncbi:hypothetical protein D3C86_1070620 [compost metagenome]
MNKIWLALLVREVMLELPDMFHTVPLSSETVDVAPVSVSAEPLSVAPDALIMAILVGPAAGALTPPGKIATLTPDRPGELTPEAVVASGAARGSAASADPPITCSQRGAPVTCVPVNVTCAVPPLTAMASNCALVNLLPVRVAVAVMPASLLSPKPIASTPLACNVALVAVREPLTTRAAKAPWPDVLTDVPSTEMFEFAPRAYKPCELMPCV